MSDDNATRRVRQDAVASIESTGFHELWGQAKASPEYDKAKWVEFQRLLIAGFAKRSKEWVRLEDVQPAMEKAEAMLNQEIARLEAEVAELKAKIARLNGSMDRLQATNANLVANWTHDHIADREVQ